MNLNMNDMMNNTMSKDNDISIPIVFHPSTFERKFELIGPEKVCVWADENDPTGEFDIWVELYRIKALMDIGNSVHKGDLGGYVATGMELSNDPRDTSWIFPGAIALEGAKVTGGSRVSGNVQLSNCYLDGGSIISSTSAKIGIGGNSHICASEIRCTSNKMTSWMQIKGASIRDSKIDGTSNAVEIDSTALYGCHVLSDDRRIVLHGGIWKDAVIRNGEDIVTIYDGNPSNSVISIYKDGHGHVVMHGPYIGSTDLNDISIIKEHDVSPFVWAAVQMAKVKFNLG